MTSNFCFQAHRLSIFFLPAGTNSASGESAALQLLLGSLKGQYSLNPGPRWTLEQRLFRGAPLEGYSSGTIQEDPAKLQSSRYLQVLSLSTHPRNNYVVLTSNSAPPQTRAGTPATSASGGESLGEPANIIAIPAGPQSEDFVQLLIARLGPMWALRQTLQVNQGLTFEVDDFRIRLGEVKQGQGSSQQTKGVIVELEWLGEMEIEAVAAEEAIKSFWSSLNIKGARDYIRIPGLGDNFGSIRQWCEALRLRA